MGVLRDSVEFANRALQQVDALNGQPRHVTAAEQLCRVMVEYGVGKLRLLLTSGWGETTIAQEELVREVFTRRRGLNLLYLKKGMCLLDQTIRTRPDAP